MAAGGMLLWGGTIAFGISTVVILAVLSRHPDRGSFVGLTALLGLSFVASLIPAGFQLRAAALIVDGHRLPKVTSKFLVTLALAGVAVSPLLGLLLHIPMLAIVFLVAQVVVAIPLAISRGALLGVHRFSALGINMTFEAGVRILLGVLAGLAFGISGLAAGLTLAAVLALVAIRVGRQEEVVTQRAITSLVDTSLTLGLLGLLVQLDLLIAPSGLSKVAAARYDLAAVPSKGVYLVLLAAGPMLFPYVRRQGHTRLVVLAAAATLALGLVVTAFLLPFRGLIGTLLGHSAPGLSLLLILGVAMSCAGTTAVIINAEVARGVGKPWPPLVAGIVAIFACLGARPDAFAFGIAVLAAQAGTLLLSLWVCLRVARRVPKPVVPGTNQQVQRSGILGWAQENWGRLP
jgi:hypothetical protein